MKRFLGLILVLALCFSLCACKSSEAKTVDDLIINIGDVTLKSEEKINEAQAQYDALTEKQKQEVEHYDALQSAQEKLVELKRNNVDNYIEDADYMLKGFRDVEGAYELLQQACEYGNTEQKKHAEDIIAAIEKSSYENTLFIKVENTVECDISAVEQGHSSYVSGYPQGWVIGCPTDSRKSGTYVYTILSMEEVALRDSPADKYLEYLFWNYEEINGNSRTNGDATYAFQDSRGNKLTIEVSAVTILELIGFRFEITITAA